MFQVRNTGPRLKLANGVKLESGLNEVADAAWEECLRNKMTQVFLESNMIQVVSGSAVVTASKSAEPDTPDRERTLAKDLVAMVKVTRDAEFLHDLLVNENRTTVIVAINSRIDALEKAGLVDFGRR